MDTQTQYPPLNQNQMPQWSRVGQLDKSRYPKPFSRDQLIAAPIAGDHGELSPSGAMDKLDDQNPALRVEYLERSIQFLKAQHQEVLSSLHAEIDKLRKENKQLHFKLVMNFQNDPNDGDSTDETNNDDKDEASKDDNLLESYLHEKEQAVMVHTGSAKSKARLLEQQTSELKHQVRELKNKNDYLTQLVDKNRSKEQSDSTVGGSGKEVNDAPTSATGSELSINMDRIVFTQHSRSVVVHDRVGSARRRPNQDELEKIVNYLHRVNQQQESELTKVKSDLKEVLYSQKWTPDAYLLAKAYVAADGAPEETDILPKLQMRSTTRKLPEIAYISRDNVSLPALKNTMGTKAVERRKRTQILQKARLHKEVL